MSSVITISSTTHYPCGLFAGNWITAAAHIVTAVIGSGVLSLAWAISTMGWVAGPIILFLFAAVTWYMSLLLADAYRNPRDTGKRNYTYPGAVSAILGKRCCLSTALVWLATLSGGLPVCSILTGRICSIWS